MMLTVEELMHLTPLEAVKAMVGEVLEPPLKPDYFRYSRPVHVRGVLTRVRCTFDRALAPVEVWDLAGNFDFVYSRIPLASFNTPRLDAPGTIPFNTRDVFKTLMETYEIPVDRADVEDRVIPNYGVQQIKSLPGSYRWVGGLSCSTSEYLRSLEEHVLHRKVGLLRLREITSLQVPAELIWMINNENSTSLVYPLNVGNITFGDPELIGALSTAQNTRVKISTHRPHYTGEVEIIYTRKAFETSWANPVNVVGPRPDTVHDMVPMLSAALGRRFHVSDFVNEEIPLGAFDEPYLVRFDPKSMGYVGDIMINYSIQNVPLENVIYVTRLDGLTYAAPVQEPLSNVIVVTNLSNFDYDPPQD